MINLPILIAYLSALFINDVRSTTTLGHHFCFRVECTLSFLLIQIYNYHPVMQIISCTVFVTQNFKAITYICRVIKRTRPRSRKYL